MTTLTGTTRKLVCRCHVLRSGTAWRPSSSSLGPVAGVCWAAPAAGLHSPSPAWGWGAGDGEPSLCCWLCHRAPSSQGWILLCWAVVRPHRLSPLSCTLPFPSLPTGESAAGPRGDSVYRKRVGGTGRGHRGLTALPEQPVPGLPARSPCDSPALRESAWGPFATPGSGTSYFCLFLRKKKIILLKL